MPPQGDSSRGRQHPPLVGAGGNAEALREWRIGRLIAHLPPRLQRAVGWLLRPSSRWARIPAGILFCLGGVLAILPVLGLWMLPIGLVLLAEDIPALRRVTDRALVWIGRRRPHWFHRDRLEALAESWDRNAANWTRVVREGLIPSRRAGTDAAIVEAIAERQPKRLLDIGCGEGWLVRAVAARTGCAAVGIDGADALIAAARAADPANEYHVVGYDGLAAADIGTDFDIVVFNYSLFAEDIVPLLRAAAARLTPRGVILIQTLHPGDGRKNGWLVEDFTAFGGGEWASMPWYYRTLESWRAALHDAGLPIRDLREPSAHGRALSLLMVCERGPSSP